MDQNTTRQNTNPMNLTDDEIRVKVAELMGWRYPGSSCLKLESWDRWIPPKGATSKKVPNYSVSVDAALTLCDRLREEDFDILITIEKAGYTVNVYIGQMALVEIEDPSLARAICLAFLRVKGLDSVAPSL